jgi:hypothetical protein
MADLRIKGDVSGYVDLVAPDVAGSTTIDLSKVVLTDNSGTFTNNLLIEKSNAQIQLTDTARSHFITTINGGRDLRINADQDIVLNSSGGNVGIGTSSPAVPLHVYDSTQGRVAIENASRRIDLLSDADGFTIRDQSAASNRFLINGSGNTLIGTTSEDILDSTPADTSGIVLKLDGNVLAAREGEVATFVRRGSWGSVIGLRKDGVNHVAIGIDDNYSAYFGSTQNNNIGIAFGSSSIYPFDTSTLSLKGNYINLGDNNTRFNNCYLVGSVFGSRGYFTNNSDWQLELNGSNANTVRFHTTASGEGIVGSIVRSTTSTTYNTTSDYRLKQNVELITDAFDRLQRLRPVRHSWNVDPDNYVDGFIAHEVQDAGLEYSVTGEKDADEMQTMDYGRITPLLTAALQEAVERIQQMETRIQELEEKLNG